MILFWFRRDLRFHDNAGFYNALIDTDEVLPAFVFDESILYKLPKDDGRVNFIYEQIAKMQEESEAHGSSMCVAKGNPLELIPQWSEEHDIRAVYTNEDYEPYATARDVKIKALLAEKGIGFKTFKDQVIFAPMKYLKKTEPLTGFIPHFQECGWPKKQNKVCLNIPQHHFLGNYIKKYYQVLLQSKH